MRKLATAMVLIIATFAIPATAATSTKTTKAKARVAADTTRLAAILSDVQHTARFDSATWKTTVNEANTLANRIYANTGGRSQARELRKHVRAMRASAMKGDADEARHHAMEALPFAYALIDWATPNQ